MSAPSSCSSSKEMMTSVGAVEKAFARVPLLATPSRTVDFPPNLQVLDVVDNVILDGRAVTDGWMETGVAAAEEPRQYS